MTTQDDRGVVRTSGGLLQPTRRVWNVTDVPDVWIHLVTQAAVAQPAVALAGGHVGNAAGVLAQGWDRGCTTKHAGLQPCVQQ